MGISAWRDRRRVAQARLKDKSNTIGGKLGRLLPPGSFVRQWLKNNEDRKRLEELLLHSEWETFLFVMDQEEVLQAGVANFKQENAATIFMDQGDVSEVATTFEQSLKSQAWVLVEPRPAEDGVRKWNVWDKSTAILLSGMVKNGQKLIKNPVDKKNRTISADSLALCQLLDSVPGLINSTDKKKVTVALTRTIRARAGLKVAKTAITLAVVGCLAAAAVCTGVGVFTLSAGVAESMVKGMASFAGQQTASAITGGVAGAATASAIGHTKVPKPAIEREECMTPEQLLAARIQRLEEAVFREDDEESLLRLGDDVVKSERWWRRRR
jgi:hypothetical protein